MEYFEAFDEGHVVDFPEYRAVSGVKRGRPKGCLQSETARAKISEAQRGEKNSMFGRRQKRRTRKLQSEATRRLWALRREVIARMEAREAAIRGGIQAQATELRPRLALTSLRTIGNMCSFR